MKIERVISEGEKISENQMIDLCGGSSLMANENHALGCGCRGTGDNTNTSWFCRCNDSSIQNPSDPGK